MGLLGTLGTKNGKEPGNYSRMYFLVVLGSLQVASEDNSSCYP